MSANCELRIADLAREFFPHLLPSLAEQLVIDLLRNDARRRAKAMQAGVQQRDDKP